MAPAIRTARQSGGNGGSVPQGEGRAATPATGAPQVVPFSQAAHRGIEPGPVFSQQPDTTQHTFGPIGLPAQGYLRRVLIDVASSGGTVGPGVGAADYPWNILNLVRLQDTNGAPLCELSGYNLFLCNVYGGYAGSPDPRNDPDYSATAAAPSFTLSIPVEIAPTGLGSLANQSAAAQYKLTVIMDTVAVIWSTAPTTAPTITITTYTDFWTLPAPADMLGRQQQRVPPFHGVAAYKTQQPNVSVNTGNNVTRITRTGSLIRLLGVVSRISGARSDTPFPDPFTLNFDGRNLQITSRRILRKVMREMIEQLNARDTGTYFFLFNFGEGRHAGENAVNSWLPTVSATRFDLSGASAGAGTLDIIVEDVSIAAVAPADRAVETSATGYHPPIAPLVAGAQ